MSDNINQPSHQMNDDEITLKELILLVQEYFNLCLKRWWLIGIIAILFAGLFAFREIRKETTYNAQLSYTTSDGGGGNLGGLLSRFTGGGRGTSILKMQGMLESRLLMEKVLLSKVEIDGKNDYLINHFGHIYEFFEEKEDPEKTLHPLTSSALSTNKERRFLKSVHGFIVERLMSQSLDEETGIASMGISSVSEELSYVLVNTLYDELEKFYIASEVGEQEKTVSALEHRADSIYNLIQSKTYGVARLQDADKGRYFATDRLPEVKTQAELEFLKTIYAEVLKNLETIKFTVASSTPTVKAIDKPMLPLKAKPKSLIKQLIIGGFLGGFLTVLFLVGRKIFQDVMKDEE